MKPILYDEFERVFDHNGIGVLSDAIDVNVDPALNGVYELEMKYPVGGIHYGDIVHRAIILSSVDPVSQAQPFRIYRIVPTSKGTVTVYARHVAYDLMGVTVSPFSAASAADALVAMRSSAVTPCEFDFWTDKSTQANMTVPVPKSIWTLLGGSQGSLLDVYGGEYEFDRFTVKLHERRGTDNGVSIRYGKNLTSLEQDSNIANYYTGVHPFWYGQEGPLVELPEKILSAEGEFTHVKIYPLDLSSEWQEAPTEDQLRTRAQRYMKENDIGTPTVSIKVEFIRLEQTEEYKDLALLERVLLGDTVHVYFPKLKVDASARVVKYRWKPLLDRYDSVTIGSVKSNIASTIVKQQQENDKKPTVTTMQYIAATLAATITGAKGGCVRQLDTDGDGMPDEWYIADNPDPALAVKVWRFNYEGLAASKTGYNGPFIMGATFEDGILAHMVRAVQVTAGTIQSADGGKTVFIDLDNGIVNIRPITDEINGIKTYFRFDADGQYIGREDDEAILRLSAGIVDVLVAGYAAATFDRTGVTAKQVTIQMLHMKGYSWIADDDGFLNLS